MIAQTGKFGQMTPFLGDNGEATLQVDYVTSPPGGVTPYLYPPSAVSGVPPANPWVVYWQRTSDDAPTKIPVQSVRDNPGGKRLVITLAGPPSDRPLNQYIWTANFMPPDGASVLPQLFSFKAKVGPSVQSKKSCDNTSPAGRPMFCAPSGATPADISVTGGFLAGGGTKPIYQLSATANVFKPKDDGGGSATARNLWHFDPGLNVAVQINQNTKPPNNRTRFDPDSITAMLDF
jgi:hypothetical protein